MRFNEIFNKFIFNENRQLNRLSSNLVNDIRHVIPQVKEIWFYGSRATGKHKRNSDTDILVIVPNNLVGEDYIEIVNKLHNLENKYFGYDIQPSKIGNILHRSASQEGKLLWSLNNKIEEDNPVLDKPTPSIRQVASKHGVSFTDIMDQLVKGVNVELEHTNDEDTAREIALDHLSEDPKYYDKLADVGLEESWQQSPAKIDYYLLQESIEDYYKKDKKYYPHRIHGIHQLVTNYKKISESIESDVKDFWQHMIRLDQRSKVDLSPGKSVSVIQCWTHLYDHVLELRGNLTPKEIVDVEYDTSGKVQSIEFTDGSTFPDKSFLDRGQGGSLDGIVTTFYPTKQSAEHALTSLHLVIPEKWKLSKVNLSETSLNEISNSSLSEIGYADALGALNMPDSEIISLASQNGTISQKPVMKFEQGNATIYFFATDDKITALILLTDGHKLRAIKNFSGQSGQVLALLNYIVNINNTRLAITPDEPLTKEGFQWIARLIKNPSGLKISDLNGNAIDIDTLKTEWKKSKSTRGTESGDTGIIISESSAKWKIRLQENESSIMPYIYFNVGNLSEASGYIPSEKEKNDPRYSMALTVDIKPDSIQKNAKAYKWKTSRAGIPPTATPSGKF